MKYKYITLESKAKIAILTLNRPEKLNAINREMIEELKRAMIEIDQDSGAKVLVITGAGRAFCSGADVNDFAQPVTPIERRNWLIGVHKVIFALSNLEKPVIAKVNGFAVGIGCSLALSADLIIAAENAKFSLIFTRIGLIPDGGSLYHLPKLVGLTKAKELIFTGRTVDANEAERIGIVNKVVSPANLGCEVEDLAIQLAEGPTVALGIAKKIMNMGLNMDVSSVLECEAFGQTLAATTEDAKEGTMAFLKKERPKFKGR